MSNISKTIGQRIRTYRLRAGFTQEALAEKAGVHPTYIGQIERGEKNLTLVSLEKVLTALDVPLNEVFMHIPSPATETIPDLCYQLIAQMTGAQQRHVYCILKEMAEMMREK